MKIENFIKKYWKAVLPILFALALGLGLIQNSQDPYFGSKTTVQKFSGPNKSLGDYFNNSSNDEHSTATFLAVGDIMLSRNVAGTIQKANDPLLPFRKMESILKSTDFNFANLESPISGKDHFNPSGSMVFNAPTAYTKGLKDYNFKIVNLANNHALDQGVKGLEYTIKYLDENNIKHVGVGMDIAAAWKPEIVEANGIKICFVGASYSSINDNGRTINNYVARIEDIENLKLKIENSRSLCNFVVATMHAGTEYTRKPNTDQIAFAHAAIDYGADMVIGAHPHWVQTIEKYCPQRQGSQEPVRDITTCGNAKYIFYSLGNFIFDQEWSQDTKEGLTLKIQITKSRGSDLQGSKIPVQLEQVELIPVIIENYSTPRPANEAETKKILEKIGETNTILK